MQVYRDAPEVYTCMEGVCVLCRHALNFMLTKPLRTQKHIERALPTTSIDCLEWYDLESDQLLNQAGEEASFLRPS